MAYSKDDEWADDIGNIIDTIYNEKVTEPELSKRLLDYDQGDDIDIIFIKAIRDFAADKDKLCYLAKKLNNLSDIETLLYKSLPIKRKDGYSLVASFLIQCLQVDLSVPQLDNILFKTRKWHEITGIYIEDAVEFLLNIKGLKDFAPVPKWVSIKEGENLSLLKTVLPGDGAEASKERNIEFIAQAHDLFHEIRGQKVRGQGINLDLEEAMQVVLSAYSEGENPEQTSAARIFGPLNRIMDRDCISNPYAVGPCRMLECICREFDDVSYEGEKIEASYSTWFTGQCKVCARSIRDLSHAVRLPVDEGGWSGCYCSIDCIRDDDTVIINEKLNIRLNNMMFTLDEAGIMDRTKV
jgi:hypothetical protein